MSAYAAASLLSTWFTGARHIKTECTEFLCVDYNSEYVKRAADWLPFRLYINFNFV